MVHSPAFKSPGPPDSRRARPQAGPRAGPTHSSMRGTNQTHDAPPPDRARTATYTPNNRPPDAFLNAKHPPPATCTLNIRCTNSTTGQPAGQPDTFTLPTPQKQYTKHQEDIVNCPHTTQLGQAKSRHAYPGTNRASPTAGEPGAFQAQHLQQTQIVAAFYNATTVTRWSQHHQDLLARNSPRDQPGWGVD